MHLLMHICDEGGVSQVKKKAKVSTMAETLVSHVVISFILNNVYYSFVRSKSGGSTLYIDVYWLKYTWSTLCPLESRSLMLCGKGPWRLRGDKLGNLKTI
jgi:hypothetical protein